MPRHSPLDGSPLEARLQLVAPYKPAWLPRPAFIALGEGALLPWTVEAADLPRIPRREQPMRVMHVITGLETGGAERMLAKLLKGGLANSFDTRVLSMTGKGAVGPDIEAAGIPVVNLGMRAGRPRFSGLWRLRSATRNFRPDLIQGWMYHGNLAASIARRFTDNRPGLVWNVRQSLYELALEKRLTRQVIRLNRRWSRSSDYIVYNSELSRRQHERFGFDGKPGRVIPNGFDLARFCPSDVARRAVRRQLRISDDAFVVGHMARLHPMKDHVGFILAATELARTEPRVHIVLAGSGVDARNQDLTARIPGEVAARFHLLGERSDVAALLNAFDLLCSSSAWGEGFPNVLGEAMACGVPCVTTDVGDSRSVVGDTGLVVQPEDPAALASALLASLGMPLKQRLAVGRAARDRIREHYGLARVVAKYAALYASLAVSPMHAKGVKPCP